MNVYDPKATCPKCRSADIATTYYPASAHEGCPMYGQNWIIAQNVAPVAWGTDFYGKEFPNRDDMREHYRQRMTAAEHFDRRCTRCRYAWVESMPEVA